MYKYVYFDLIEFKKSLNISCVTSVKPNDKTFKGSPI